MSTIQRVRPFLLDGGLPMLQHVAADDKLTDVSPLAAFGLTPDEGDGTIPLPSPAALRRPWIRYATLNGNVYRLQLTCKTKESPRWGLLVIGDMVRDFGSTEWSYAAFFSSTDGKTFGRPFCPWATPKEGADRWVIGQDKARPHWVGVTVCHDLAPNPEAITVARPFLLPYNGWQYDWQYCRYFSALFPERSMLPKMTGEDVAKLGNHEYVGVKWEQRTPPGTQLQVPFPAYDERFQVIRYLAKNGDPRVLVKGPLLTDLFGERNQVWTAALGVCTNLELLKQDGIGSWEFRMLPPKRLKTIDQVTVDKIATVIDEGHAGEESEGAAEVEGQPS